MRKVMRVIFWLFFAISFGALAVYVFYYIDRPQIDISISSVNDYWNWQSAWLKNNDVRINSYVVFAVSGSIAIISWLGLIFMPQKKVGVDNN